MGDFPVLLDPVRERNCFLRATWERTKEMVEVADSVGDEAGRATVDLLVRNASDSVLLSMGGEGHSI